MSLTASEFVTSLRADVPETNDTINDHLADQEGELLLHVLTADLRRLAIDWFRTGRIDATERLLSVLDRGFREGDEYVQNAVAVSFVEDLGWWEPEMQPRIETLPGALAHEIESAEIERLRPALVRPTAHIAEECGAQASGRPSAYLPS